MSKTAKTSIEINSILANRWSPRAFNEKGISHESLLKILEAIRWAPSASNIQPWQIFVGKKQDATYSKIFETLVEFNQMWAKFAPVLILCCSKKNTDQGKPNSSYKYDAGQAMAHLTFQAASENIFVHQMGGFSVNKASELFEIPDDIEPLSVLALGYLGDPKILHERMQVSELADRERKSLGGFVFQNKHGEVSSLINK